MGCAKYPGKPYRRQFGGFDGGVEVGFSGVWSKPKFNHLCEILSEAKAAADNEQTSFKIIDLGGCPVAVSATGASGAVRYKFVIHCGGLKIYIHSNPSGNIQPVRVRYGFETLCKESLFAVHERLIDWLNEIGFDVTDEKLSRVDMQVMTERPVSDYITPIISGESICLARGEYAIHGNNRTNEAQSYTVGKSIQLCIYDKRREILSAHTDDVKYELFRREILDGGDLPETLTRIEFRLNRTTLKRYGINTIQDLKESAQSMGRILTGDWIRILKTKKKRGKENKQEVAECWQEVQSLFDYYFDFSEDFQDSPDYQERSPQELKEHEPVKTGKNGEILERQAMGCITSRMAMIFPKISDISEIKDYVCGVVDRLFVHMIDKFTLKRRHNEVIRGYAPLVLEADFSESETPWDCLDVSVMERARKEYFKRLEENSTPF